MDNVELKGPWWETGILKPETHTKLIQNRLGIGRRSGLGDHNIHAMWTALPENVTSTEREWARKVILGEPASMLGPVYIGDEATALKHIHAMTGAFLRNFIDVRIMPAAEIVSHTYEKTDFSATVLFIPDCGAQGVVGGMPTNSKNIVLQSIAERVRMREPFSIYAPSPQMLQHNLGDRTASLLKAELFAVKV